MRINANRIEFYVRHVNDESRLQNNMFQLLLFAAGCGYYRQMSLVLIFHYPIAAKNECSDGVFTFNITRSANSRIVRTKNLCFFSLKINSQRNGCNEKLRFHHASLTQMKLNL